jgi:hypothetical protein
LEPLHTIRAVRARFTEDHTYLDCDLIAIVYLVESFDRIYHKFITTSKIIVDRKNDYNFNKDYFYGLFLEGLCRYDFPDTKDAVNKGSGEFLVRICARIAKEYNKALFLTVFWSTEIGIQESHDKLFSFYNKKFGFKRICTFEFPTKYSYSLMTTGTATS